VAQDQVFQKSATKSSVSGYPIEINFRLEAHFVDYFAHA